MTSLPTWKRSPVTLGQLCFVHLSFHQTFLELNEANKPSTIKFQYLLPSPSSLAQSTVGSNPAFLAFAFRYLLKKIGAPDSYLDAMGTGYSKSGQRQYTSQKAVDEFSAVPRQKIVALYAAFEADFKMFGYNASAYFTEES